MYPSMTSISWPRMYASWAAARRAPSARVMVLPLCRSGVSVTTKVLAAAARRDLVWTL